MEEALRESEESLRISEEKYRTIFDQAADSIVLVDAETGKMEQFNTRAHENLGYTREEFANLKISDFEVLESKEETANHIKKIIMDGADIFETQQRTKSGLIRDIQINARAIRIGGKQYLHSIWRDITKRKQAELIEKQYTNDLLTLFKAATALAEVLPSENIFRVIAEQVHQLAMGARFVIVSSFDEGANLFRVQASSGNQSDISAFSSFLGQELLGLNTPISVGGRTALTSGSLEKVPAGIFDLAAGLIPEPVARQIEERFGIGDTYAMGFYWQGKLFGSLNILMAKGSELQNPHLIETFMREVAVALQRKQAMDDLARAKDDLELRIIERTRELRELAHRLVDAQEKERATIGSALHDEIGQYLTYTTLLIDRAVRKPDRETLAEAKSTVQEAIAKIRDLSSMLSPRLLRSAGLIQALVSLVEEYTRRTRIKVEFIHSDVFNEVPEEVALASYRIIQESLTNIVRHARASEVKVRLSCEYERLHLEVEDNGVGFDTEKVKKSTGLTSMRERTLALSGEFTIKSDQGRGTRVIAGIPLP